MWQRPKAVRARAQEHMTFVKEILFVMPEKYEILRKRVLYKSYGEILFQKVASGLVLHFLHKGFSYNLFKNSVFYTNTEHRRIGTNSAFVDPFLKFRPGRGSKAEGPGPGRTRARPGSGASLFL